MTNRFQHFSEEKTKWCSNCSRHRPADGGTHITMNKGRNQRFLCSVCVKAKGGRNASN
jgi:hypothetical protein